MLFYDANYLNNILTYNHTQYTIIIFFTYNLILKQERISTWWKPCLQNCTEMVNTQGFILMPIMGLWTTRVLEKFSRFMKYLLSRSVKFSLTMFTMLWFVLFTVLMSYLRNHTSKHIEVLKTFVKLVLDVESTRASQFIRSWKALLMEFIKTPTSPTSWQI